MDHRIESKHGDYAVPHKDQWRVSIRLTPTKFIDVDVPTEGEASFVIKQMNDDSSALCDIIRIASDEGMEELGDMLRKIDAAESNSYEMGTAKLITQQIVEYFYIQKIARMIDD